MASRTKKHLNFFDYYAVHVYRRDCFEREAHRSECHITPERDHYLRKKLTELKYGIKNYEPNEK